jgi:hypothetical protein
MRTYHGRRRRLPRVPPISRDREACRTRRLLSWGGASHSWQRREIRVGCTVLGQLGCRGVWADMVGLEVGSGSGL